MYQIFNNKDDKYQSLINDIRSKNNCSCFGLNFVQKCFVLALLKKSVFVVNSTNEIFKYVEELKSIDKNLKIGFILSRLENLSFSIFNEIDESVRYIESINDLLNNDIDILLITPSVLLQKVLNKDALNSSKILLEKGQSYILSSLINQLTKIGYKRTSSVTKKGEFSLKGDILDIFATNNNFPYKISFFDDEIENIYSFDLENINVIENVESLQVLPTTFCIYEEEDIKNAIKSIEEAIKNSKTKVEEDRLNQIKEEILNNENVKSNFLLPFIKNFDATILDYTQDFTLIFDEPKLVLENIDSEYENFFNSFLTLKEGGELTLKNKDILIKKSEIKFDNTALAFLNLNTSNKLFESKKVYSFLSDYLRQYNKSFNLLKTDIINYLQNSYNIILCVENNEHKKALENFFNDNQILYKSFEEENFELSKGIVEIVKSPLKYGTIFLEERVVILGNFDIFGATKVEKERKDTRVFTIPKVGDYVVHAFFGICKCTDINKINFNGYEKDYMTLEFFGGDKIYLPCEKANLVSSYIGEENPKLNKLGSNDFEKAKNKVKSEVKELAFDLLKLYAEREKQKGYKFLSDEFLESEFDARFAYTLTSDQAKAIEDIKKDMESDKPMDRLVCGDVGYGKTEVALRAIFKAVLNGKQVCFIAPTTILSEQHYKTCLSRLSEFSVSVEVLNRFKSIKEQKQILENLKEGNINVICGTHRLLSSDVEFKDLGLLIIDEEQRFGVEHKEKLKNLKNNIDVLTLSATPIPRTLNMSMLKIRDISIIDTPPTNRTPVVTKVVEYSDSVLIDAINNELSRDGQVFIIYNRVETIESFASHIRSLFGDKRIEVIHGKLDKKILENSIKKMYDGEIDILISTVLIENGIDLPNANTMIVIDSDKLGLSQLYQLRGRVGRSNKKAFAYFTFEKDKALSEIAYKRLEALNSYTNFGSGFKIAMKDLELRGAGDIFGGKQSGHIEKVGYDMYVKLINETLKELKGEKIKKEREIKIDVSLNSFIPKDYIIDESERFKIYEEIANIKCEEDYNELYEKLNKMYKSVPTEITNLCYVAYLKNILSGLNILRVVINSTEAKIYFYEKEDLISEEITQKIKKHKEIQENVANKCLIFDYNLGILDKIKAIIKIFE